MNLGDLIFGAAQLRQQQLERQRLEAEQAHEAESRARQQQQWAEEEYLRPFKRRELMNAFEDAAREREWAIADRARKEGEWRQAQESQALASWMSPRVVQAPDGLSAAVAPPADAGGVLGSAVGGMMPGMGMPGLAESLEALGTTALVLPTEEGRELAQHARRHQVTLDQTNRNMALQMAMGLRRPIGAPRAAGGGGTGRAAAAAAGAAGGGAVDEGGPLRQAQTEWDREFTKHFNVYFRAAIKEGTTPENASAAAEKIARAKIRRPRPEAPALREPLSNELKEGLGLALTLSPASANGQVASPDPRQQAREQSDRAAYQQAMESYRLYNEQRRQAVEPSPPAQVLPYSPSPIGPALTSFVAPPSALPSLTEVGNFLGRTIESPEERAAIDDLMASGDLGRIMSPAKTVDIFSDLPEMQRRAAQIRQHELERLIERRVRANAIRTLLTDPNVPLDAAQRAGQWMSDRAQGLSRAVQPWADWATDKVERLAIPQKRQR